MQITLGLAWDGTLDRRLSSSTVHTPRNGAESLALGGRSALETFLFCDCLYFYGSVIFGCLQGRRCQGSARPAQGETQALRRLSRDHLLDARSRQFSEGEVGPASPSTFGAMTCTPVSPAALP
jgi:hypothetical protein